MNNKCLEVFRFTKEYSVRRLEERDTEAILSLCSKNPLYYQYCPPFVTKDGILQDMHALPPNKDISDKYYVGYFKDDLLIAILDLIVAFPDDKTAFIGFFMTDVSVQNKGMGSKIIKELCDCLCSAGMESVRLAWVEGNPQAEHFWHKNGFIETGDKSDMGEYTVVVAQRDLI